MNLVGEIAQYAIETDQIIKELVAQRDEARALVSKQTEEIQTLQSELQRVRNPDKPNPVLPIRPPNAALNGMEEKQ